MITEDDLNQMFKYHSPSEYQIERYKIIRNASRYLANIIIENTLPSADQSAAIRKLRECVMTANSSIALEVVEKKMRACEKALEIMKENGNELANFIKISRMDHSNGTPSVIHFILQDEPVSKVGLNGCQVGDIIEYLIILLECFNSNIECNENKKTIEYLEMALNWQDKRTEDRIYREVEGTEEN